MVQTFHLFPAVAQNNIESMILALFQTLSLLFKRRCSNDILNTSKITSIECTKNIHNVHKSRCFKDLFKTKDVHKASSRHPKLVLKPSLRHFIECMKVIPYVSITHSQKDLKPGVL